VKAPAIEVGSRWRDRQTGNDVELSMDEGPTVIWKGIDGAPGGRAIVSYFLERFTRLPDEQDEGAKR
jgi:hypothetical protein